MRRIERELDKLLDLILKGGAADKINTKMVQLEHRKAEVERQLADAETRSSTPRWRHSIVNRSAPSTRLYRMIPRQPGLGPVRFCGPW